MFGISWSELLLIALISCFAIKAEDIPRIIKFLKNLKNKFFELKGQIISSISEIDGLKELKDELNSTHEEIKTIIDLDGNPQRIYDIEDVKKDLK